jgi:ADP-ribose pyrophosphatase
MSKNNDDIKVSKIKKVYQGYNNINSYKFKHRLFNSSWSKTLRREMIITKECVCLLPYDKQNNLILLIKQFRIGAYLAGTNPWQIEVIGGSREISENNPKITIQREAYEEASLCVNYKSLKKVRTILNSSGITNEKTLIYFSHSNLAKIKGVFGNKFENEDIKVLKLKPRKAFNMVKKGEINSVNTIIALNWLKDNIKNV